ncbi:Na+/phosphate symporter [Paenibacillus phyllosphaerae]|uniref:Na+/phosphate symporter n=1 Tax=Paenibacillus phyllosphaerae TaxID=274593 RepID=A0A7W5B1N5_9BACL|nr:HPP family protein [Paenibacillus phyllosphaerae]MBB3112231.1 Na+/phosphate symporter [Paenibacillus phyllosphaerae]
MLNLRVWAICGYVAVIYWISLHLPALKMLFYPTLGAFCFLFMSRSDYRGIGRIALGAFIASLIGTLIFSFVPGIMALFINTLLIIQLKHLLKLNAPPVLAVSFIPFFSGAAEAWHVPVLIGVSLTGLTLLLMGVDWLEKKLPDMSWLPIRRQETTKAEQAP